MRIAGSKQAINNLVKWSARDDWILYYEEVSAHHLDSIMDKFDVTTEELAEILGDGFDMVFGVILEDFFATRFGDDGELNVIDDYLKRRGWREKVPAKRYLAAIRDSVISLYEVVGFDPGKTADERRKLLLDRRDPRNVLPGRRLLRGLCRRLFDLLGGCFRRLLYRRFVGEDVVPGYPAAGAGASDARKVIPSLFGQPPGHRRGAHLSWQCGRSGFRLGLDGARQRNAGRRGLRLL